MNARYIPLSDRIADSLDVKRLQDSIKYATKLTITCCTNFMTSIWTYNKANKLFNKKIYIFFIIILNMANINGSIQKLYDYLPPTK